MTTEEYFAWLRTEDGGHCLFAKEIGDGIYAAIKPLMFHWTLIIGEVGDQCSIADRFCYPDRAAAIRAIFTWDGEGQPTGWHRQSDDRPTPTRGRSRPRVYCFLRASMKRPAARLKHTTAEDDHDHNPEEWELRYRTARSGRENRVIFYCRKCGHREKPQPWPLQQIKVGMSNCSVCGASTFFVAYQDGVENSVAEKVMEGELPT